MNNDKTTRSFYTSTVREGVVGSVVSLVDEYFLYNINKTYNVSNCQEQSYIFEISKNKSAVSEIII